MAKQINVAMKKILFVLFAFIPLLMNGQDVKTPEKYSGKVYKESKLNTKPEFPGGIAAFYKYVNSHFRIPEIEDDGNFVIQVSFVIEIDGTMSNFEILKDPGFQMGNEVIRVLSKVEKKWSPGIKKNKPVRSLYTFSITINIKS